MNKLKERKEKFHYLGDLSKYQLKLQETEYVKYKTESYTEYQNYLYKRALYGLNALAEKELNNICNKKRGRINKVYVKGQIAINLYKQKITNDKSNKLFEKFFPDSKITKYLVSKGANPNHQNKQGQTAAHFAIAYKFFDLSQWMFENGADDTLTNKFHLTAYDGLSPEGDEDEEN